MGPAEMEEMPISSVVTSRSRSGEEMGNAELEERKRSGEEEKEEKRRKKIKFGGLCYNRRAEARITTNSLRLPQTVHPQAKPGHKRASGGLIKPHTISATTRGSEHVFALLCVFTPWDSPCAQLHFKSLEHVGFIA
jgi:hypothetical protein